MSYVSCRALTQYYAQALEAEKGLEPLDQNQAENRLFLCHGDLDQHHILPGKQEAVFIEFSQMHLGHQVSDLYRFMRKVMEKHGWDEYLGGAMLDAYDAVQPMGREGAAATCIFCFCTRKNTGSS